MKSLVMADRYDRHGDIEAEPIVLELIGDRLHLALDDATAIVISAEDILDVLLAEAEGVRAA